MATGTDLSSLCLFFLTPHSTHQLQLHPHKHVGCFGLGVGGDWEVDMLLEPAESLWKLLSESGLA